MFQKFMLIALAGALGTVTRCGMVEVSTKLFGNVLPWGTLLVNLAGCFAVGLMWALFQGRWPVSHEVQLMVLVGFMGAFTTFSAFILETGELARTSGWLHASVNIVMQNGLGLISLFAGISLGRMA